MSAIINAACKFMPILTRPLLTKPLPMTQIAIRTISNTFTNKQPDTTTLSFKVFKIKHMESFESYCSPAIHELSGGDKKLMATSYDEHCRACYNEYLRGIANPGNNPATML